MCGEGKYKIRRRNTIMVVGWLGVLERGRRGAWSAIKNGISLRFWEGRSWKNPVPLKSGTRLRWKKKTKSKKSRCWGTAKKRYALVFWVVGEKGWEKGNSKKSRGWGIVNRNGIRLFFLGAPQSVRRACVGKEVWKNPQSVGGVGKEKFEKPVVSWGACVGKGSLKNPQSVGGACVGKGSLKNPWSVGALVLGKWSLKNPQSVGGVGKAKFVPPPAFWYR